MTLLLSGVTCTFVPEAGVQGRAIREINPQNGSQWAQPFQYRVQVYLS